MISKRKKLFDPAGEIKVIKEIRSMFGLALQDAIIVDIWARCSSLNEKGTTDERPKYPAQEYELLEDHLE